MYIAYRIDIERSLLLENFCLNRDESVKFWRDLTVERCLIMVAGTGRSGGARYQDADGFEIYVYK